MAGSRTWVLKGSLWIQAVFLLVLTSILADTNAWIGAILTGVGLFFVVIGIIAAHKRRIGYLYLYATLVGLWQILALTHILIICGLIALPKHNIDPAFIVGQKIVEDPSYPLKIAIPVLYGFQWCTWCVILVCMVSLRLEKVDPAHGFEIQDPKQQQRHSLNTINNNSRNNTSTSLPSSGGNNSTNGSSNGSNPRMNQHLFNFRQSVIAPIGGGGGGVAAGSLKHSGGASSSASSNSRSTGSGVSSGIGVGMDGHSITRMNKGKEPMDKGRYTNDIEMPQAPERAWDQMERRASSDSNNAIFIPSDPRISQVVVTFKDDAQDIQQEHGSLSFVSTGLSKQKQKQQVPEATTIYITNHLYGQSSNTDGMVNDGQPGSSQSTAAPAERGGLGASKSDSFILNFAASNESFSDMIFNSSEDSVVLPLAPQPAAIPTTTSTAPHLSGPSISSSSVPQPPAATATKEMAGFHSRSSDEITHNPARIRGTATKVSLTLSSDSSSSELSALSSDSEDLLEFAPLSTTRVHLKSEQAEGSRSQPPVPSPQHGPDGVVAGLAMTSVDPLHIIPKNQSEQQQQQQSITASETKSFGDPENESHQYASHGPSDGDEYYSPQAQPNSSDSSHSLSSLASSTSTRSRNDDRSARGQVFGQKGAAGAKTASSTSSPHPPVASSSSSSSKSPPPTPTSASGQQAQASSSPFNYTPAPFTPFPAGTGSVSITPTTATATATTRARTISHRRVSLPLHYWRNRTSQPTPSSINTSIPSSIVDNSALISPISSPPPPPQSSSSTSSSSFTQNYLTNPFLSKKKKLQIPTIVIHADDEDGEPPKVLSAQDIEYLTTMPPVPLRPLIQPWDEDYQDEEDEGEVSGEDERDAYDEVGAYGDDDEYDDYPHPHQRQELYHQQQQYQQQQQQQRPRYYNEAGMNYAEYNEREREQELTGIRRRIDQVQRTHHQQQQHEQQQRQQEQHQQQRRRVSQHQQDFEHVRAMQMRLAKEDVASNDLGEQDPYALDVPIDLAIDRTDLEGLEAKKRGASGNTRYDLL